MPKTVLTFIEWGILYSDFSFGDLNNRCEPKDLIYFPSVISADILEGISNYSCWYSFVSEYQYVEANAFTPNNFHELIKDPLMFYSGKTSYEQIFKVIFACAPRTFL